MNNKFIPKSQDKSVISIRLEDATIKRIDQLAADTNISRNELIKQCIDFALERIDDTYSNQGNR